MEIKVDLNTIEIKDSESGKVVKVRTLRSVEEVAGYIEETEKEGIIDRLEQAVIEKINK